MTIKEDVKERVLCSVMNFLSDTSTVSSTPIYLILFQICFRDANAIPPFESPHAIPRTLHLYALS
jgi:hypothetical protein